MTDDTGKPKDDYSARDAYVTPLTEGYKSVNVVIVPLEHWEDILKRLEMLDRIKEYIYQTFGTDLS